MRKDKFNDENLTYDEDDKNIYNAFIDLGLLIPRTEEEVERAEKSLEGTPRVTLPTDLLDSSNILKNIKAILNEEESETATEEVSNIKSFLGYVSDQTHLPPSKIAQEIECPKEFLIQISEDVVKNPVREEITNRTVKKFPQLNRNLVSRSLRQSPQKIAAARDKPYKNMKITFENILDNSGIKGAEKEFWLNLNEAENEDS